MGVGHDGWDGSADVLLPLSWRCKSLPTILLRAPQCVRVLAAPPQLTRDEQEVHLDQKR